jgi:hypothetical protein
VIAHEADGGVKALNTMETISEAGVKFQSVSEPWANTTTHAGKMIRLPNNAACASVGHES